jgi:hypothetical protein
VGGGRGRLARQGGAQQGDEGDEQSRQGIGARRPRAFSAMRACGREGGMGCHDDEDN